jgi:outer membrane protein assembly factor BamA
MPCYWKPGATSILLILAMIFCLSIAASATDEEPVDGEDATDITETGDPDYYNIGELVGEADESTPIGIVDNIEITGSYWVKNSVILRQLTFDIGDDITQADLNLSEKRLLQLNGLFWYGKFEVVPTDTEGHVDLVLEVKMRRTWFIYPAQSGATVGDRNFFTTGKGVQAGYYQIDDVTYAFLSYTDPQFNGGHNSWTFEGHLIEGDIITRTDRDFGAGEQYLYEKRGGYVRISTKLKEKIYIGTTLKIEDISTEVKTDPFPGLFVDDKFYLSGAWIPAGTLVTLSISLSKGKYNSAFFPTEGYTLYFNADNSYEFLGSDFNFSRFLLYGTKYFGLDNKGRHSLAFKGEYGLAAGSDIPNYELPILDYQVRGLGGATDRGKSHIALSGEYRFYMWPDILQGVVFVDSGRAWDDVTFNFDDYQTTYGVGIRYQTFEHWGFNVLFRADYSLGPYDQRWYFGIGHAF